jgi:hypothetical protein
MSLTSHLANSSSPVREFFARRLPNTPAAPFLILPADPPSPSDQSESRFTTHQIWRPGDIQVFPDAPDGFPWGGVGTAFDYRVRFFYSVTPVDELVAALGALRIGDRSSRAGPVAFGELREEIEPLIRSQSDLWAKRPQAEERRLNQLCYVLALYEQCFRTLASPDWPLLRLGPKASLAEVAKLAEPRIVDDLVALSELYRQSPEPVLRGSPAILNPTFAASAALGGADADLILGRTLLDLKTTKKARPDRPTLWQLAGYALSDFDDRYSIDSVGFYYARFGKTITWSLGEFLTQLAGQAVDLSELRKSFKRVLGPSITNR